MKKGQFEIKNRIDNIGCSDGLSLGGIQSNGVIVYFG